MTEPMRFLEEQPLSPTLRQLVAQLRDDSPSLSARMLGTLRSTIAEYGALGDTLAQDVYRAGIKNAELWYDALLAGGRPDEDNLRWIGRFSRRRHSQALSLPALLQAYRTGARVYMDAMLARVREQPVLADEVLFIVPPFLLYYSDLVSSTLSEAYFVEQSRELRWKQQLQARLGAAVLHAAGPFDEAARALGIPVDQPHVALALRLAGLPPAGGDGTHALCERLHESLSGRAQDDAAPVGGSLYRGHWVAWLPVVPGEPVDERERRLGEWARRLLGAFPELESSGLGLPGIGADGWRGSAEQALAAIELGRHLRRDDVAFRYSEFALDTLMRQSSEMAVLCGELIASISAEPHLLETLEAYFEHRQNHKVTAAALGIHRNTLLHRLGHIESILGASFDDMGWLSRLYLALRQRRIGHRLPPALH